MIKESIFTIANGCDSDEVFRIDIFCENWELHCLHPSALLGSDSIHLKPHMERTEYFKLSSQNTHIKFKLQYM